MSTGLASSVLTPPRLAYRLRRLLRDQWLPPERIRGIQSARLRTLIAHAYEHVPYYRRLLDGAGVKPDDIQSADDLAAIPITTKEQLLAQPREELLSDAVDLDRCTTLRTSGSLGMPIDVTFRPRDKEWWALLALRGWMANRYHLGLKTLVLTDSRFREGRRHWYEYLGLHRKTYASIHDDVEVQLDIARETSPDVIRGMPSDVFLLAQAVREQRATEVAPRIVLTSAELLDDGARGFINETFGVELADFYGSIESGWIAWECPAHVGYHINADCLAVEFVKDGRPALASEPGEVVVTNLHSFAMPFIRYSVGDIGTPLETRCECGRGLPLMKTVEGRTIECVTLLDGRQISPYRLTCAVEQVGGIHRYQIVQSSPDKLVVRIIPGRGFGEGTLSGVSEELGRLLGDGIGVEPVVVSELPKGNADKFRVVVGLPRDGPRAS